MKSVLISLSPYYYYLIGEGFKKIEVRKSFPKAENWNKTVLCYMTKDLKSFARIPDVFQEKYAPHIGNVGMRFVCDDVFACNYDYSDGVDIDDDSLLFTRLERDEINIYAKGKTIYCWHISNLKIYDKPTDLSRFSKVGFGSPVPLIHPPQSWCYAEKI